ncbi:MAG: hypothetical protein KGJ53_05080, partial [Alphaproteobacteria bacterium]|nr:hypothetical protein [Alphaproteobacteria bacterium]
GGLIAGTIDIGSAALINWRSPVFILHAVAGGLLGMATFSDGVFAAILGLILQWTMSLVIAAAYVIASGTCSVLKRYWIAGGLVYGIGIFVVMNYIVVPHSAYGHLPHFTALKALENLVAMLLFGIVVAFFAGSIAADNPTNSSPPDLNLHNSR